MGALQDEKDIDGLAPIANVLLLDTSTISTGLDSGVSVQRGAPIINLNMIFWILTRSAGLYP